MIKQAPRPLQVFAMVAFVAACVGVLLYLWLSFGGTIPLKSEGYRFHVRFPEATLLAVQSDVRTAGVPVGKVVELETGPNNTTEATLEMRARYAPVPRDARAMLRQKSLLGETYVDLTTGNPGSGTVPDGGLLADARVSETVELDEIFRTFDDETQEAFQVWMQSQAAASEGRGFDLNAFLGNLPQFVETSDDILTELDAQERAISDTIRGTGELFSALSARNGQLSRLITQSNRLFEVTAERNREFAAIWEELPRFARESRLTLPRLTEFADNARPVVRQLQPAASEFDRTFKALDRLSPSFQGFFEGLGPLITKSRRGVPAMERVLADLPPLLADFEPFLRQVNPVLGNLAQNRRELTSFFANIVGATTARNPNLNPRITNVDPVHFLRASATLNPQALAYYSRALGQTRRNAYMAPGGLERLAEGLLSFDTRTCSNGDPAPPEETGTEELRNLAQLAQEFAFRTDRSVNDGRDVLRPPCVGQGDYPGFDTQFPRLEPEP